MLNFDCTEEVDEFTNFLNEFEDELKDKTLSDKDKSKVSTCRSVQGENKVNILTNNFQDVTDNSAKNNCKSDYSSYYIISRRTKTEKQLSRKRKKPKLLSG